MARTYEIEKAWDGNVCEREGRNGRIYTSNGRWQWVVVVDGQADYAFDTKREAVARVKQLQGLEREHGVDVTPALKDVEVRSEGSIVLFWTVSESAVEWWAAHVSEHQAGQFAGAHVVEHRYADDIIVGLREAGFGVSLRGAR